MNDSASARRISAGVTNVPAIAKAWQIGQSSWLFLSSGDG